MASIGIGVAKAGSGILGALGGHNEKIAAARRQNEQLARQYRQQLKIREQDWTHRS